MKNFYYAKATRNLPLLLEGKLVFEILHLKGYNQQQQQQLDFSTIISAVDFSFTI